VTAHVDVTRVDGPHSPERTVAGARLLADTVRWLNYATMGGSGIGYAGDVDSVLGGIASAAGGLRQTLDQLEACLQADLHTGRLRMDDRYCLAATKANRSQDPAVAVQTASANLGDAKAALEYLRQALNRARGFTSAMSMTPEQEAGDVDA
jgi:hypothetical protein